ncbi:MAG: YggS family pyridoxal phosphate-dependent enzyme, partial [Oscillospiraceae bacterium]|nr:YggS family pyridoxal phosphate-dependent enzyme [Oscillospiraceae bacterium]
NVAQVQQRIRAAAGDRKVLLVAATKMNDPETIQRAIAAGIDASGENRVQEMMEKLEQGAYEGAPLHFIGSLQKNKVKFVVGNCDLIHSVNSVSLLEAINKRAAALGIVQDVLLEVNIAREESKTGFLPELLPAFLETAAALGSIRVRGLMAIPPIQKKVGENRQYFAQMRQLFIDIGAKKYDNVSMDFLSMGMSNDFEDAILEGANVVRVGTAIFGARNYGQTTQ